MSEVDLFVLIETVPVPIALLFYLGSVAAVFDFVFYQNYLIQRCKYFFI